MDSPDIKDFDTECSTGRLRLRIMNLSNGHLILVSDTDTFRLGLTAVSIPAGPGSASPTSTGLMGAGPDNTVVRTIAESVAKWTNGACLLILALTRVDRAVAVEIINVLKPHFLG